jgi:hypothetical protein
MAVTALGMKEAKKYLSRSANAEIGTEAGLQHGQCSTIRRIVLFIVKSNAASYRRAVVYLTSEYWRLLCAFNSNTQKYPTDYHAFPLIVYPSPRHGFPIYVHQDQ